MSTLKDILEGEADQNPTTPEAPTADTPDTSGQPRDEQGRFAATGEPAAAEPPVAAPDTPPVSSESGAAPVEPGSEPEPPHVPTAALTDERRKRQAAEARNQELERQLAAFQQPQQSAQPQAQQPPQAQAPALPDMFEDPEGYTAAIIQQTEQRMLSFKLDTSEAMARQRHPDFDEKMQAFQQAVQRRPDLAQQMLGELDPAGFAYKVGSDFLELNQLGSLDAYKAQIRAEIEAELRAQMQPAPAAPAAPAQAAPAAPVIPTSLADAPSARAPGSAGAPDAGPPSLSQILSR